MFEPAFAVGGSNRSEKRLYKQKTPYPQEMGTAENARHTHPLRIHKMLRSVLKVGTGINL